MLNDNQMKSNAALRQERKMFIRSKAKIMYRVENSLKGAFLVYGAFVLLGAFLPLYYLAPFLRAPFLRAPFLRAPF